MVTAIPPGKTYLSEIAMLGTSTNDVGVGDSFFRINVAMNGDPLTTGNITYSKGFGARAPGCAEWFLGGQVNSFHAIVGLHDAFKGTSQARVLVFKDGVLAYDTGKLSNVGSDPGQIIDLNVLGTIKLSMQFTNSADTGTSEALDGVDVCDPYVMSFGQNDLANAKTPLYTFMPVSVLGWDNAIGTATAENGVDMVAEPYYRGQAWRITGGLNRSSSFLPMYPDRNTIVHDFTIFATNATAYAYTNAIYPDIGSGPLSTRHLNAFVTVPMTLTNGINHWYVTNQWSNPNDNLRWLYVVWMNTASNTTAQFRLVGWQMTHY
jgi:hypothetical protein